MLAAAGWRRGTSQMAYQYTSARYEGSSRAAPERVHMLFDHTNQPGDAIQNHVLLFFFHAGYPNQRANERASERARSAPGILIMGFSQARGKGLGHQYIFERAKACIAIFSSFFFVSFRRVA